MEMVDTKVRVIYVKGASGEYQVCDNTKMRKTWFQELIRPNNDGKPE